MSFGEEVAATRAKVQGQILLEEKVNKQRATYLLDTFTFEQFYANWNGTKVDAKKQYAKLIKYLNTKIKDEKN